MSQGRGHLHDKGKKVVEDMRSKRSRPTNTHRPLSGFFIRETSNTTNYSVTSSDDDDDVPTQLGTMLPTSGNLTALGLGEHEESSNGNHSREATCYASFASLQGTHISIEDIASHPALGADNALVGDDDDDVPTQLATMLPTAAMAENMEGREGPAEVNGRSSDVWQHFIRSKRGDGKDVATCKRCQKSLGAEAKNGTTHLRRHVGTCNGGNRQKRPRPSPPASQPQPQRPSGDNPGSSLVHPAAAVLAQMVGFHGYPSSIVEDKCFRSFVSVLNPDFQMPSRTAVERICHHHAQEAMNQLKETLESNQGKISLATGTSHTVQGKALYMAWQFIDDEWTLQKRIAQVFPVVPFPPYHHDTLLGSKEVSIELNEGVLEQLSLATTTPTLKEAVLHWVLPDKLFSVAWGEELEEHLEQKDFLNDLCSGNQLSEPLDVPQVFCITYTSGVLNSVADSIFSKLEVGFTDSCFKAVKALTLSQEQRDQMLSDLGLQRLGRYDKRWFSYYCALEVLHSAGSVVEEQEFNASQIGELLRQSRHNYAQLMELLGLSRFKQNILTELLRKILGMIYHALVAISLPRCCPTSNICLKELMKLKDALQSDAEEASQVPSMAAAYAKIRGFGRDHDIDSALKEAQGVVDKFLKESYQYLSIPVVLDPRFKMEYIRNIFEDVFEESESENCIKKVMQTIQYLFDEHGRQMRHNISGEGTSSSAEARTGGTSAVDVDGIILDESIVELEHYLQDSRVDSGEGDDGGGGFDILQWWNTNKCRYPTLARMARDALAMPASDILTPEDASAVRSMVSWPYGSH